MRRKQYDRTACFESTEAMERGVDEVLRELQEQAPETFKSRSDVYRMATAMFLYARRKWHPGQSDANSASGDDAT
jgi:hypothetical protein